MRLDWLKNYNPLNLSLRRSLYKPKFYLHLNWKKSIRKNYQKYLQIVFIPVNIAFHISDHLEIPDMEAVGMQGQFRRKVLHAKQVHELIESLEYLNSRMIEALAVTDLKLTLRTKQRLISQQGLVLSGMWRTFTKVKTGP